MLGGISGKLVDDKRKTLGEAGLEVNFRSLDRYAASEAFQNPSHYIFKKCTAIAPISYNILSLRERMQAGNECLFAITSFAQASRGDR